MAPRAGGLPFGVVALMGLGLLGAGALLRDWGLLLSAGDAAGASSGFSGSMGNGLSSQHRWAAMDMEIDELRRLLNSSQAALRGEIRSLRATVETIRSADRGDQLQPKALAAGPTPGSFSEDSLVTAAKMLQDRLKTCCVGKAEARRDSITFFEALAILAAADMKKIDVLIESGVASGFSSEIWGRFYAGTHVKIYGIDKNSEGQNDNEAARKRLAPFANVEFMEGDSLDEIPKLLERHKGQRIGVFIDGPKTHLQAKLALETLQRTSDVQFVAMHDVSKPALMNDGLWAAESAWQRIVLRTWEKQWRQEFSHLDGCSSDYKKNYGWGLVIVPGLNDMPMSDNDKEFSKAIDT